MHFLVSIDPTALISLHLAPTVFRGRSVIVLYGEKSFAVNCAAFTVIGRALRFQRDQHEAMLYIMDKYAFP